MIDTTRFRLGSLCAALALSSGAWLATPVAAQQKPLLTPADYGKFELLGASRLAPNGRWLAYGVTRVDEKAELRIRPLDRDTLRVVPWGSGPVFSSDSRWVAWTVGLPPDEVKRLEKDKKPIRTGVALLELATGRERSFATTRAHAFDATGRFLALHAYAPEEPKGKGSDLRVLDLSTGSEVAFGNVAEFAWTDGRSLLALTIATGSDAGNGVQVYDASIGRLRSLDASGSSYKQLAWREKGTDLAVYRSSEPAAKKGSRHVLLAWRALDAAREPARLTLEPASVAIADTLEVVEHFRPRWSDDGKRIAFGLRPRSRATPDSTPKAAGDSARAKGAADDELPVMQLWHTADVAIYPQQKFREQATARRALVALWEPDAKRVVRVGSDVMENVTLLEGWRRAVERVSAPYGWGTMFGRPYHDVWAVDLSSGSRSKALEKVRYSWQSAGGRYLLWFDGKDYWTHDLESGKRTNVTASLPAVFADTAHDTPTDQLPPFGVGGWEEGDRAVLLYDQYDVWRVAPNGSGATRLTRGAEEEVEHRVVDLDPKREAIDPAAPLYVSLHGEWSEKRGFARLRPGKAPERLLFVDKFVGPLSKADSAPVFAYGVEARDDSPDVFVAGPDLAAARQVTATNPFLADYAWTRTELVEYKNETGRRLQGVLLYPAQFDPTKKYPMVVNAYEILSQTAHQFEVPSERDYYSYIAWAQNGYFVFVPDIVFRKRDPGVSLLETLRPAVAKIDAMGLIDRTRVGFIGHSWGGYHATYAATHSDIFAATVAGAPLTDFVSFMGQIHWAQGSAELDHWETGQARMEVPYWEDPEAHHRNSPIHNVQNMKTPLLMAFGNEDGTVDWDQGTEFYNFARRAGKQMVLLVYEGEAHSFRKKPNQIDYHRRILEWFGHYLKGEPAPAWITKGVSVEALDAEKKRVANPGTIVP